jgi:hypothetical protein
MSRFAEIFGAKYKHGTGQVRLREAGQQAAHIFDCVSQIHCLWQLSRNENIDETVADDSIRYLIEEVNQACEGLKRAIEYRDDLNGKAKERACDGTDEMDRDARER